MEEIVAQKNREDRSLVHEARLKSLQNKKKSRSDTEGQTVPHTTSRIFRGHKALGHISNHIPSVLRYVHLRRENFIVTCIGKSINTFVSNKLSLLSTSGTLDKEINCMAGDVYHVYTGSGNVIHAWRRGVEITHTYTAGHDSMILFLLPFGEHLISIDESGVMCLRDIKTEELLSTVKLDTNFRVSALMHPATYINKILLGSQEGTMQLWNLKKMRLVHLFTNWAGSSILHIAQAPAIDCVAIALSNKRLVVHNLRYDTTIMTLKCEDQPLTIAFRTDNVETMVTGNSNGSLTLWDLNTQEVLQHVVSSHSHPVTGLQSFHQEPIFFSSSADNSLKVWIFDGPGGTFRELCSRSGHCKPPKRIRFFGKTGCDIISAGIDGRMRKFHIYNETLNSIWGENRIPSDVCRKRGEFSSSIIDFTSQSVADATHHGDMAVLTEDEAAVTVWSTHNSKQESAVLFPHRKRLPHAEFTATSIFLTSCGQFVVVGYDNGGVHRYNIQSGLHRFAYGHPNMAHNGAVRCVAVDSINSCVASGGSDSVLKLWKFNASETFETFSFPGGICSLFRPRKTDLLGVILDSFEIVVIDLNSKNIVREFKNISSPIEDAVFSPDMRWLTASSADCLVRTWDLPTGNMIDIFRLESIVTYMDYSPNGDYLATALNDNIGILLWNNKTFYTYVSLMPIPMDFEPPIVNFDSLQELPQIEDADVQITGFDYESPECLKENFITFSQAPETRWKNLLHLDTIRERNKPKQPLKQHIAPFFLPSELKLPGSGDDPTIQLASKTNGTTAKGDDGQSKILSINFALSPFASALLDEPKKENYHDTICKLLEKMGPAQIETEFIQLGPDGGGSLELLQSFVCFIQAAMSSKTHSETCHAYLALFLRIHIDELTKHADFFECQETLRKTLVESTDEFINSFYEVLGYLSLIKSGLY